jgi:phage tail sheath protein FI
MSTTQPYPGVYIQDISNSVHTIHGVDTSTTAFIGLAKKGPPNKATTIHGFVEYERIFGGLWRKSNMSYAVYQYFLNGGSNAVIIRVHDDAKAATYEIEGSFKTSSF